jgi:hypothetical protein
MMDANEPLWMPRGSVRAIVALMLVATVCAAAILQRGVPDWLIAIVGSVVTFYYTKRPANGGDGENDR